MASSIFLTSLFFIVASFLGCCETHSFFRETRSHNAWCCMFIISLAVAFVSGIWWVWS